MKEEMKLEINALVEGQETRAAFALHLNHEAPCFAASEV
jgi:hypothetical protein